MATIKTNSTESRALATLRYTLTPKLLSEALNVTKLRMILPCLL